MPIGPILRAMRHNRTRFALIILEIAITLAIVTNAVNMILDQREKMIKKSGFDDDNLLAVSYAPFAPEFKQPGYSDSVTYADIRALEKIPGVKAAAATHLLPWQGGGSSGTYRADGTPEKFQAQFYAATRNVFDTLGVKVIEGRNFTANDTPADPNESTKVTIISRGLARKLWGDANPIGHVISTGDDGSRPRTVIGVIDNFYNPYAWDIGDYVLFTPGRAWDESGGAYLIRTEPGALKSVASQVEARLLAVNSGRVFRSRTIAEVKEGFFSGGKLVVNAMTGVIVLLVFVTALGIVGITSLSVSERTKQIGTRRALGATKGDILRHFLAENWIVTTIGLVLGVAATYALNFFLVSQFTDAKLPWYLVAVGMVLLWLNGLVATVPPAMRAATVSPAIATRSV
ncbi:MAG: ABC transporter permease [Acidobacteria bacterium]|nr:ABC transporter permease [Acidobacteriota bacterium]MBV9478849.1 ABC transporter permease [Acidobacteriota bacterium]